MSRRRTGVGQCWTGGASPGRTLPYPLLVRASVDAQAAATRTEQDRDGTQGHGLPGTGGTEQRGDATGAQVLDNQGRAVPGLLAAGSDAGGAYGVGYAGGLAMAMTFGITAARTAGWE